MVIRVIYQNQRYDFVKASRLDEFIETGAIASFQRRSGWVRVGIDPIRSTTTDPSYTYKGKERRQSQEGMAEAA
ncbi:MAG TPA: hypothetical protein VL087_03480 [Nitrospirota bacterium]|nr:hypothetical protein [Nitrospirota bacterium]